ncbi:MAG: hypothetical protein XD93_1200 [candidate division WS6 bacterium 34_10]|uniref:Uncharacterized protein n=1 Tax=candidate division WS6 bacterium 34_10 TaxID=1641389 RepID=A0A101HFH0_9BACT|nr:MAG: hypothetical protein XD93_1200 [candidate division WS6 bacterium 34_10]
MIGVEDNLKKSSVEIDGKTTPYELVRQIVSENDEIDQLCLVAYKYVPLQVDENELNKEFWVSKQNFLEDGFLESLSNKFSKDVQIGLFSRVSVGYEGDKHIPMMDLEISKSRVNLKKIISRFTHLGLNDGWLLETGNSYHYYGRTLIEDDKWISNFLSRCLLTSIVNSRSDIEDIVDSRYVGHSLRRGSCCLRLTTWDDKSFVPKVVYDFKTEKFLD